MKRLLMLGFLGVFVAMNVLIVRASLEQGIVPAIRDLWPDPWVQATLADCYFAFLTIWLWVAWRERSLLARILWLLLFCTLGSVAIAGYVLWQLWKLPPSASVGDLFRPVPAGV